MLNKSNYHAAVRATPAYRKLVRRRGRLVWSMSVIMFGLLMLVTALAVFTDVLDGQVVPGLNGAIIAAYVLFFLPVIFAHVYLARTGKFDELERQVLDEAEHGIYQSGASV